MKRVEIPISTGMRDFLTGYVTTHDGEENFRVSVEMSEVEGTWNPCPVLYFI